MRTIYYRRARIVFSIVPTLRRPSWSVIAALLISAYGALLRLDAFTGKYGSVEHPAWARIATHELAPVARRLRPAHVQWGRIPRPYIGGDPINYVKFAREMTSFYQPHVREPVFLATTKLALAAMDDQDAAVSLASASASVLTIFATYLLGAAVVSPLAGVIAAGLYAIEYDSITWAVDGWRDGTFAAFFVLTAWALVRFRDHASLGRALALAFAGGAACLTRLTALSFILPALVWITIERRGDGRRRIEYTGAAIVVLAAIVAPYLASCALATGDPFISVNHHTGYYRHAEGLSDREPMAVGDYLRGKFGRRPVETLDVATTGLLVRPFAIKWHPFGIWTPALAAFLRWAALAGLALWLFQPVGRLLTLVLLTALLPFAFTWNLGGGGEWRFTMHVYAIYLVAAVAAIRAASRALSRPPAWRDVRWQLASVAILVAGGAAFYFVLPWFVAREAIAAAEAVNIEAGPRDRVFFRQGWSPPHTDGNVTSRVSLTERASIHFPLPQKRSYEIALRLDPVAPEIQKRVTVLLNRHRLGTLLVSWNPDRVGSYRLILPHGWIRVGDNELEVVPDTMVTAASGRSPLPWLEPHERLGLRLWYLRVLDSAP